MASSEPPQKKQKLSLKLQKREPLKEVNNRFSSPVKEDVFEEAAKGVIPSNTKKSNLWALRTFESWMKQRNVRMPGDPVPSSILQCHDKSAVCKFMRYFVLEVRREDGSQYPPSSIRSLLCGVNRILKDNEVPFSIMNKEDPSFRELFLTLDTVTSTLHRQGIGAIKDSASVISYEHETIFWQKKILGYDTPKTLQKAVFFVVGLNFVLRGVEEHHSLQP